MIWFIIGIVFFAITLYVHKHSYNSKRGNEYYNRLPCPLWFVIIAFIIFCIPVCGIIVFALGAILYILTRLIYTNLYFNPTGFIKKIVNILTKEV